MENINIAIVSDDKNYGRAIALALLNVCRTLIVNVFNMEEFATGQEKLQDPKLKGRVSCNGDGFDMVLYDGKSAPAGIKVPVIKLVEKPSMACKCAEKGRYCIYKYSPAQKLVSDLFEIYTRETGRMAAGVAKDNVHILALNSCQGGTGSTTVAMAVCQELARFHKLSVLYISLEEMESTGCYIDGPSSVNSMSQYIYNLFKHKRGRNLILPVEKTQYRPFIESFIIRDDFGVEAFKPTKGRNPLASLSQDEMYSFVESIISLGRYDVIVIDVGVSLTMSALACTEMAEKICLVSKKSISLGREINYLQYLASLGGEDMLRKMIRIENLCETKHNDFFDEEDAHPLIKTRIYIEKDNIYSQEGGVLKVLLEGQFGQNITKLTNMMIEPLA